MIIGITGGSGVGKTTALGVLKELGAVIIDCDLVYHELLESSKSMLDEIHKRFPTAFEGESGGGAISRKKLGSIVFDDPEALNDLNRITHKYVLIKVERILGEKPDNRHAAIDAIALIESGVLEKCDVVVGILAPHKVRIERIMIREGISSQYAASRIDSQKPDEFYIKNCDYILRNDGADSEEFIEKCKVLFSKIIEEDKNGQ